MDLLLATRNAHKAREFAEILGNEFRVEDLAGYSKIVMPREDGKTFEENAILKAVHISKDRSASGGQARHLLVIADDSGLEVDSLGGAPGILSARYAGENATDEQNIDKLLRDLARRNIPADQRAARFRCVIALARDEKFLGTFEGAVEGTIIEHPRGDRGFGYDPIFQPDGFDKTFGELSAETKNKISHRAKAIAALREAFAQRKV
jgi:XTP/dITP diphosphohydrolase